MKMLQVALLQMTAHGNDQEANLVKGEAFCRRAQEMGADLALFPEMWNIGYTLYPGCPGDFERSGMEPPQQKRAREQWQAQAVGPDSPFIQRFRSLARELEMAIAITYLEKWPGAPRNTLRKSSSRPTPALLRKTAGLLTSPTVQPPFVRTDAAERPYDPAKR